jgi:hypothetical protein
MKQTKIDSDLKRLWRTARTLWIKYCGISDEYKMLRARWLYLHDENKLMALPYLKRDNKNDEMKTFDLLDDHTKELENRFIDLGFKRDEMERFKSFKQKVKKVPTTGLIAEMKLTEDYFFDLANFVGLLKSAFFQRTVSAEIQHVVSGIPHSPERTIGNELFYLAADNVARRYCECLNIPYGKWDGFITFIPPIEEGGFYGAFYNPSPYLKLFHISMSEEAKYFVGSYLALAHEFGHSIMRRRIKWAETAKMGDVFWMENLFNRIYQDSLEFLNDQGKYRCQNCPFYDYLTTPYDLYKVGFVYEIFIELIADIIAAYIGGMNCMHSFIDFAEGMISNPKNQIPFLLRIISGYYYLKLEGFDITHLRERIEDIIEISNRTRADYGFSCSTLVDHSDFLNCIAGICARWAKGIYDFNNKFGEIFFDELEDYVINLLYQYNQFQGSIDTEEVFKTENLDKLFGFVFPEEKRDKLLIPDSNSQLFSMIVKEGYKFEIEDGEKEQIINSLLGGRPIPDKDPRQILHCYYEAYKESEGQKRPHYAATIYSLAFNTFSQNRGEKE